MRSDKFFRTLTDAGYTKNRVSGSHHVFVKIGRGAVPVAVHSHTVRDDVVREILRIIQMSDSEYRERCSGISSERVAGNRADGSGGCGVDDSRINDSSSTNKNTNSDAGTNTSKASTTITTAGHPKERTRKYSDNTLLTTLDEETYQQMRDKQRKGKEERGEEIKNTAERLMSESPIQIALGKSSIVLEEIAAFLNEKNNADLHLYLSESDLLELAFLGVTAWLEEAKFMLQQFELWLKKSNPFREAGVFHRLQEMRFEFRDFGGLLVVLQKLEKQHWREREAVCQVRTSALRDMAALSLTGWDLRIEHINHVRALAVDIDGNNMLHELWCHHFIQFDAFLKTLLDQKGLNLPEEISSGSLGSDFKARARESLGFQIFRNMPQYGIPQTLERTHAANCFIQLLSSDWFKNNDSFSAFRGAMVSVAEARDCLSQRVAELAGSGLGDPAITGGKAWKVGVWMLVKEDGPQFVRILQKIAESLLTLLSGGIVVIGKKWSLNFKFSDDNVNNEAQGTDGQAFTFWNDNVNAAANSADFLHFREELDLHIGSIVMSDLQPFLEVLLSEYEFVRLSPRRRRCRSMTPKLAADITYILALFSMETNTVAKVYSEKGSNVGYEEMRNTLRSGAMVTWRGVWEAGRVGGNGNGKSSDGSGSRSSTTGVIFDDTTAPKEFLAGTWDVSSNPSLLLLPFQVGRANYIIQDFLRVGLLEANLKDLPTGYWPQAKEALMLLSLVLLRFMVVFEVPNLPAEFSNHADLLETMRLVRGKYEIADVIKLLGAKTDATLREASAEDERRLQGVFAKFEVSKVPELIAEGRHLLATALNPGTGALICDSPMLWTVHRMAVIEEEMSESAEKIIRAHRKTRNFVAVFADRGGVGRFLPQEAVQKGVSDSAGSKLESVDTADSDNADSRLSSSSSSSSSSSTAGSLKSKMWGIALVVLAFIALALFWVMRKLWDAFVWVLTSMWRIFVLFLGLMLWGVSLLIGRNLIGLAWDVIQWCLVKDRQERIPHLVDCRAWQELTRGSVSKAAGTKKKADRAWSGGISGCATMNAPAVVDQVCRASTPPSVDKKKHCSSRAPVRKRTDVFQQRIENAFEGGSGSTSLPLPAVTDDIPNVAHSPVVDEKKAAGAPAVVDKNVGSSAHQPHLEENPAETYIHSLQNRKKRVDSTNNRKCQQQKKCRRLPAKSRKRN